MSVRRSLPPALKWSSLALLAFGVIVAAASLLHVPVSATLRPQAIMEARFQEGGKAFAATPRHGSLIHSDVPDGSRASTLVLYEDGRPLGPAHSLHRDIASLGGGRYSHWNGALFFSASDGSDPRTNGRTYRYEASASLSSDYTLAGLACIAAALLPWAWLAAIAGWRFGRTVTIPSPLPLVRMTAARIGNGVRTPAAKRAGLVVAFIAGLVIALGSAVGVPVNGAIDPQKIVAASALEGRNAYAVPLPHSREYLRSDDGDHPEASNVRLYEDGRALGPGHSVHGEVAGQGRGRFSHWSGSLLFSASDNSDPRSNGRAYRYEGRLQLPIAFLYLGLLFAAVAFALLARSQIAQAGTRVAEEAAALRRRIAGKSLHNVVGSGLLRGRDSMRTAWASGALSRALAWLLVATGIGIAALSAVGVSVEGDIDPSKIIPAGPQGTHSYAAPLSHASVLLRSDDRGESSLRLLEDGRPLGPAHSIHADIASTGRGRYSHWAGAILFSTSDNSDPRANGRTYRYEDQARLGTAFGIFGMLLAACALPWTFRRGAIRAFATRAAQRLYGVTRDTGFAALAAVLVVASVGIVAGIELGVPIRAYIPPGSIAAVTLEGGQTAFAAIPAHGSRYLRSDGPGNLESNLRLYEDGRLLGPPHSVHADIATYGGGLYSHWNGSLVFSASDNSDPRQNGRHYGYEARGQLPDAWYFVVALLLLAAAGLRRKAVAAGARRLAAAVRLRSTPSLPATAGTILVAVSLAWLFHLLHLAEDDVSAHDVVAITAYCAAILFVQGLAVARVPRATLALFVAFGVLDSYSLFFVFSGELGRQPAYAQAVMLLAPAAVLFVLFRLLERLPRWRLRVAGAAAAGAAALAAFAFNDLLGPAGEAAGAPDPAGYGLRSVQFQRKPNVYFLGFDAMAPAALARKYLRIDRPPYLDAIERHKGRVIPNLFADQVPTKDFWGTTLNVVRPRNPGRTVTGQDRAFVLETFLANGYETHFTYANSYMGPRAGPRLTSYWFAEDYSTCSFLDPVQYARGFLGYCPLRQVLGLGYSGPFGIPTEVADRFYLQRLRSVLHRGTATPHFFAAHYPWPGHTDLAYASETRQFAHFKQEYGQRSLDAARMIDRMLTEIHASDPKAVVFIFGDHGPWISRADSYRELPGFVVQDRHGILGAVFGADDCMRYIGGEKERATTSSQVVAGILQCLAGGRSVLARPIDFGTISQSPIPLRFQDYAYE